jgi:hypothetical protein
MASRVFDAQQPPWPPGAHFFPLWRAPELLPITSPRDVSDTFPFPVIAALKHPVLSAYGHAAQAPIQSHIICRDDSTPRRLRPRLSHFLRRLRRPLQDHQGAVIISPQAQVEPVVHQERAAQDRLLLKELAIKTLDAIRGVFVEPAQANRGRRP